MSKAKLRSVVLAPDPKLTAIKTRATKLMSAWHDVEVIDTKTFEAASEAVKEAVSLRKDLKALPVYVELAAQKAQIKAKEKLLKDVDKAIEAVEDILRDALSSYAARQREAQEKLVSKAIDKGQDAKAAAIAAMPFIPESSGLSFSEHWHAEITDLKALIEAVASEAVPLDAITPNLVYLNAKARDAKAEDIGIPGVKGVKETSSAIRT